MAFTATEESRRRIDKIIADAKARVIEQPYEHSQDRVLHSELSRRRIQQIIAEVKARSTAKTETKPRQTYEEKMKQAAREYQDAVEQAKKRLVLRETNADSLCWADHDWSAVYDNA